MANEANSSPPRRNGERGHLMAALMLMLAIMMIMSTVVTQKWVDLLQREQEAEMMFRAKSITHAIRRHRRDQGQTQPLIKLEQLMEAGTRGQYFLRKLYEDPLVKDGKWGMLYQGPGGQIIDPNSAAAEAGFVLGGTERQNTSQNQNPAGGLVNTGGEGGVQEVGGLPIIGVKSLCKKPAFRIYKGFTEYREWQFTLYDVDLQARQQNAQQQGAGQVPGGVPNPGAGGRNR